MEIVKWFKRADKFLSTLSLRRATRSPCAVCKGVRDFYPRSPCGERRSVTATAYVAVKISIHALLAESDDKAMKQMGYQPEFLSTLSLRRATVLIASLASVAPLFLSTLSLRRATVVGFNVVALIYNFYPRSPCGERRVLFSFHFLTVRFLSTLSLRRATYLDAWKSHYVRHFYPRSPCGERPERSQDKRE